MGLILIVAILSILGGGFSLAYGTSSLTSRTREGEIGPVELSIDEKQSAYHPEWMACIAIGAGLIILAFDLSRA